MTQFTALQEAHAFAEAFLLTTEPSSLKHPYKKDKGRYPRVRKFIENYLLNGSSETFNSSPIQQGVGQLMMFCAQFAQQKAQTGERDEVYKEIVNIIIPKLIDKALNFPTNPIDQLAGLIYLGAAMLKKLMKHRAMFPFLI
ncbi:hypothetical protein LSPH24S_07269 [Lysinibacillus sphaericus]